MRVTAKEISDLVIEELPQKQAFKLITESLAEKKQDFCPCLKKFVGWRFKIVVPKDHILGDDGVFTYDIIFMSPKKAETVIDAKFHLDNGWNFTKSTYNLNR